jgi:prefoldin subunit 5
LREHRQMLEKRLENLKKIQSNLDSLGSRVAELEAAREQLITQQDTMRRIRERIDLPLPMTD